MESFDLTNAVQWCHLLKMAEKRSKTIGEMNQRELVGLAIQGAPIAELCFERKSTVCPEVYLPESVTFACIDSFWNGAKKLMKDRNVKALVFKCRKLRKTKIPHLIEITELDKVPLDTQLREYTGDGFGMLSFHNETDIHKLTPCGVIVHKKTGARFYIPDGNGQAGSELLQETCS